MSCCGQCEGIEDIFDEETAKKDLKRYHKKGVDKSTQMLIDALSDNSLKGLSLIDIGGGIGAIQHKLFNHGIQKAVHVDGSTSYINTAKQEAERLEITDKIEYHHGNFVDIAPALAPADVVTLDRVLCCFDDMYGLVSSSSSLAKKYYALVYPQDSAIAKFVTSIGNLFLRITNNSFRTFIHPTEEVENIIFKNNFERVHFSRKGIWQVVVYAR